LLEYIAQSDEQNDGDHRVEGGHEDLQQFHKMPPTAICSKKMRFSGKTEKTGLQKCDLSHPSYQMKGYFVKRGCSP
jgi:hypothetical protein